MKDGNRNVCTEVFSGEIDLQQSNFKRKHENRKIFRQCLVKHYIIGMMIDYRTSANQELREMIKGKVLEVYGEECFIKVIKQINNLIKQQDSISVSDIENIKKLLPNLDIQSEYLGVDFWNDNPIFKKYSSISKKALLQVLKQYDKDYLRLFNYGEKAPIIYEFNQIFVGFNVSTTMSRKKLIEMKSQAEVENWQKLFNQQMYSNQEWRIS